MTKILLFFLVFVTYSCKPQNKEPITIKPIKMENHHEYNNLVTSKFETFNVKRFDENKDKAEDYIYKSSDNATVREFGDNASGYFVNISNKNSLFNVTKAYYANSNIKTKGPSFKDDCEIGIWYDFDEKGKLIKETDLDKPFKIKIEDIIEFINKNKGDLNSTFTSIHRLYDDKVKKRIWEIYYSGKYENKHGLFNIIIDDSTSEIVKVIQILGKEGEKEIIFKK